MAKTICPHCRYDRSTDTVVSGALKGAGIGVCSLFHPALGAVALTGLALNAWNNSGKEEIKCPNCQRYYHT